MLSWKSMQLWKIGSLKSIQPEYVDHENINSKFYKSKVTFKFTNNEKGHTENSTFIIFITLYKTFNYQRKVRQIISHIDNTSYMLHFLFTHYVWRKDIQS